MHKENDKRTERKRRGVDKKGKKAKRKKRGFFVLKSKISKCECVVKGALYFGRKYGLLFPEKNHCKKMCCCGFCWLFFSVKNW